jgi:signal transduction histidine kinase
MPRAGTPDRLRIGVLGTSADADEWTSVLSSRALEVVAAQDAASVLRANPSMVLAFTTPDEAARITAELSASQPTPPLAILVGPKAQEHPHTRLVKALAEGKREWEGTFDAIVDPVAILDRDGTVVRANLGLARVADRPIEQIVSMHYGQLLGAPVDGEDTIAASLADGQPRTRDVRFERLAALQQVTTSPLRDGRGTRGLVLILKDVGEVREQQERLLQASRLADIGQLAAGVAHEINTPLASIALRAESLLKAAQDPRLTEIDSFRNFPRYLKTIDEEIFRCKKIIGALLDFSRSRRPEVRDTDLNQLAEKATDLVGHQMRLKQIELRRRLDPTLPRIQADDGQLRQALIALLMNALDATSTGGSVEVITAPSPSGRVTLTVADDGAGIAREHLDKIFSPFFTTKPVGQGTGLGLAICHGIVTSHGGEITVESELGRGTRVSLVLPTGRPGGSPAPATETPGRPMAPAPPEPNG